MYYILVGTLGRLIQLNLCFRQTQVNLDKSSGIFHFGRNYSNDVENPVKENIYSNRTRLKDDDTEQQTCMHQREEEIRKHNT